MDLVRCFIWCESSGWVVLPYHLLLPSTDTGPHVPCRLAERELRVARGHGTARYGGHAGKPPYGIESGRGRCGRPLRPSLHTPGASKDGRRNGARMDDWKYFVDEWDHDHRPRSGSPEMECRRRVCHDVLLVCLKIFTSQILVFVSRRQDRYRFCFH